MVPLSGAVATFIVAMDFENNTPYAAKFYSGHFGPQEKCAWVIARATFRYDASTSSIVPSRDAWGVFESPVETEVGTFPSDNVFVRDGCDVVIAGSVRLDREVTRHSLLVRAGNFSNELVAYGDRVWERTAGGALAPSAPKPFCEMPLDWRRAYGGSTTYEGQTAPHALNPVGAGLCWSADDALGRHLPNLEYPAQLISRWEDRPLPAGWGPITNAPVWRATKWFTERAERGLGAPTPDELALVSMRFFEGASPPAMIAPSIEPGAVVEVMGLRPTPQRFTVPDLRLRVEARVGRDVIARALSLSGVWWIASHDIVVLTARANFRYPYRRRELREATLDVTR